MFHFEHISRQFFAFKADALFVNVLLPVCRIHWALLTHFQANTSILNRPGFPVLPPLAQRASERNHIIHLLILLLVDVKSYLTSTLLGDSSCHITICDRYSNANGSRLQYDTWFKFCSVKDCGPRFNLSHVDLNNSSFI